MPAEVRRRGGGQQRAQFVQLSGGRGDHHHRRISTAGKRLGGMAQKNADHRAGEMFMRRGNDTIAPEFTDGLRERCDDASQQALGAERNFCALERLLQLP